VNILKKHIPLLICWFVNSLVLFIFNNFLPKDVVLGNGWLSSVMAIILMGLLLTVLDHVFKHVNKMRFHLKGRNMLMAYYLMANVVSFWILARIPSFSGFGITSFWMAILLGIAVTMVQWLTRQGLKKYKLI
jgi:uncharacterized membrane protein YvlD (DUF360 family)